MDFLGTWLITTLATMAAIYLVPGIETVGGTYLGPIMTALALALVNALIKPIMQILSLPITIMTLGLFALVINALMLELAASLSRNVFGAGIEISSFGSAFVGAIVISIVSAVLGVVFSA
jgi:putative membrane protein